MYWFGKSLARLEAFLRAILACMSLIHNTEKTPLLLDGKVLRDKAILELKKASSAMAVVPTLAILQIGALAESAAYIGQKKKFAEKIGARVLHVEFPDSVSEQELTSRIQELNTDNAVHGIIVQLPIPAALPKQKIIDSISPEKDVDGLTSQNAVAFEAGDKSAFVPATARGVLSLLRGYDIEVSGKKVTVIGRSALVGHPIAVLCSHAGAFVTVCHKGTENIPEKSRTADILVVAIGQPRFINEHYVSSGQVVVDVGINSVLSDPSVPEPVIKLEYEIPKRRLVGDVDFESVQGVVSAISPVPGGVGPMTVLSLFENLFDAVSKVSHH